MPPHPRGAALDAGSARLALALTASVIFAVVLWRTAWMCDDAFITLRSIDNFVHGYGLRWNPAERVQTFTHPAWLLVLTPFYAVTREPVFTTLAVQACLSIGSLFLVMRFVAPTLGQAAVVAALMVSSKALTDFSTSGLENPLTHAALAGVFVLWRQRSESRWALAWLVAGASAALLCRQDLVLLLAPILVSRIISTPRPRLWPILIGILPIVLWETFALVYYGTLVPNTALAKLGTAVPAGDLMWQGVLYWRATFLLDPVTVVAILAGALFLLVAGGSAGRLVAVGGLCYGLYVIRIGGDFMSGRFLTPLLFWILLGVAGIPSAVWRSRRPWLALLPAGIILAAGLLGPGTAPLLSGAGFGADPKDEQTWQDGVGDERRFYYPTLGLLRQLGYGGRRADNPWAQAGLAARARSQEIPQAIAASNVGLFGYYAGPRVHVIDRNALCDPLLARLPAKSGWRIGHFTREVPDGYVDGQRRGTNGITDPGLFDFYERVRLVIEGPLWTRARWNTIVMLTAGRLKP